MHQSLRAILLGFLGVLPLLSYAEGSRQLTPNTNNLALTDPANTRAGFLTHDANIDATQAVSFGFLKPATWSGFGQAFTEDYRMYVHLRPGETLNYGVHRIARAATHNDLILTLRVGAGTGTVVQQTTLARNTASIDQAELLTTQAGVIDDANQALAGPLPSAGGYQPLQYTNNTASNQEVYVEFTQTDEAAQTDDQKRSEYDFWDFTVRDAAGAEKPGRLYSKHWAFSTGASAGTDAFQNRLAAGFRLFPMIESRNTPGTFFVKEIELAGLRPLGFFFVCNEFGSTTAAGTSIEQRRRSQVSRTTYSQYPIFVQNPDASVWPSAALPTVGVTPRAYCRNGITEVAFTTTSAETGQFDILIDINGNGTRDTDEPLLRQTLAAGTSNTIVWNGRRRAAADVDGNPPTGALVAAGTVIKFDFTSFGAPVHFPLYDAEGNPDGFRVRNIRPGAGNTYDRLYWDDANLTNFATRTTQLSGVDSTPGVHPWGVGTSNEGDGYTVNTWTYGFAVFQGATEFTYTSACDNDVDGVADNVDIDDDNDGILDVVESFTPTGTGAASINPSSFAGASSPVLYLDGTYTHPVLGAFRDLNNDGINDVFDTDRDGIPNHFDLDADGDGLTDAFEANGNSNPTTAQGYTFSQTVSVRGTVYTFQSLFDPALGKYVTTTAAAATAAGASAGVGPNGLPDAVETSVVYGTSGNGSNTVLAANQSSASKYTLTDSDTDSRSASGQTATNYNFLDVDSDNDGILDNREAQSTAAYRAPTGVDTDRDGIDNAYDPTPGTGIAAGTALVSVVNTGGAAAADMFDFDSDGDNNATLPIYRQTADWTEGFDTNRNGVAGDEILAKAQAFAAANPGKANYYAIVGTGSSASGSSPFLQDSDNDDVPNFLDEDSQYYYDDNFNGLVDLYDPAYGGAPSTAPRRLATQADADFRTATQATPLPVTLVSFAARTAGADALLTWTTASELNNAGFEVERSSDAVKFEKIGFVAGRGTTSQEGAYRFVDAGAARNGRTWYYRLRQLDADGQATYSGVRSVSFDGSKRGVAAVYPAPATATATLDLMALPLGTYTITLVNAQGQQVGTLSAQGGVAQPLPITGLAAGLYQVRINGQNLRLTAPLLKQ
ncbi:T9SS type A sorting domain-containing protein [Hymenobacter weizhouensis]|uniref:T9SS type A sorting domain-containing protein n=1 Tax=Hymenobacter sp. YIM 151500-1 TaxID=2987689 RepID=UPI002226F60C|nr:T9SS type A sorting domain-containing protein [Hymenobacter sp. YIM 151500-1]UYZ63921.1 T9SS type A sorting domain-containing protein [Hymenobacter sp. YIM 151500-1]